MSQSIFFLLFLIHVKIVMVKIHKISCLKSNMVNLAAGNVLPRPGDINCRNSICVSAKKHLRLGAPVLDGHFVAQWINYMFFVRMNNESLNCCSWNLVFSKRFTAILTYHQILWFPLFPKNLHFRLKCLLNLRQPLSN